MTTAPDISTLTASDLLALKLAIEERLAAIRQRHIEEGATLGLNLVNGDGKKQRRRRANTLKEAE